MNNNKETKKNSHNKSKTPTEDCKQQEQSKNNNSRQQASECMRKEIKTHGEGRNGVFAIRLLELTKTKTL
jgi:hypothetical protein